MIFRRVALLVVSLVLLTACDTPTAPTYARNQQFTLAPGGTANITDTTARIRFDVVAADSRCPANALCVQAGEAVVRIQVWSNTASGTYDLHTGSLQPAVHEDLTIALVQLAPYPSGAQSIEAKDYRATFLVK
jgi:hypothetical protein